SVITYTVAVANNGPSDARRVVVTDHLPTTRQTTYGSDTGGCTLSGDTLTCDLGDLPAGTGKRFDISITVQGARGDVTNRASVGSATVDPNAANNTAIQTRSEERRVGKECRCGAVAPGYKTARKRPGRVGGGRCALAEAHLAGLS